LGKKSILVVPNGRANERERKPICFNYHSRMMITDKRLKGKVHQLSPGGCDQKKKDQVLGGKEGPTFRNPKEHVSTETKKGRLDCNQFRLSSRAARRERRGRAAPKKRGSINNIANGTPWGRNLPSSIS